MKKVTIHITNNKAVLKSDTGKVKEIKDCKDELDACIKALQAIQIPCKIKLNCHHPILKKLLPEINKGVHNINELAENYDKWQVLSLLHLMKKIKNIS